VELNMSTVLFQRAEQEVALDLQVQELSEKLDRIAAAVERIDRRREELEDLVTDLMPAVNGALGMAMRRLDALEKNGALGVARAAGQALEVAATTIDPEDLAAVADQAGTGVRTLRALTAPDVQALTERSLAAVRDARKGRPSTLRQILRAMREPRVRRGLGAMIGVLRVLGEGVSPARSGAAVDGGTAPRRRVNPRPQAPRPAPSTQAPAAPPAPIGADGKAQTCTLAGHTVQLDGERFMLDRSAWTPVLAEALAQEAGLDTLTDEHWRVIDFCREDAGANGAAPGMRRITAQLGIPARDLYRLFPGGPGILAARIAGLGKPKSCV
jgi:TusE/DsrC/DsvC family sulfur relay protein